MAREDFLEIGFLKFSFDGRITRAAVREVSPSDRIRFGIPESGVMVRAMELFNRLKSRPGRHDSFSFVNAAPRDSSGRAYQGFIVRMIPFPDTFAESGGIVQAFLYSDWRRMSEYLCGRRYAHDTGALSREFMNFGELLRQAERPEGISFFS